MKEMSYLHSDDFLNLENLKPSLNYVPQTWVNQIHKAEVEFFLFSFLGWGGGKEWAV